MSHKAIVLYGGSFNPPANSHICLAQDILDKYEDIEKIIFMPVSNLYKKEGLIDNEHRYNMLKLICDYNAKFEVSRIEIDNERQLYTIETLEILKEQFPNHNIYFTIGTDNLKELNTWKRPDELMAKYKILVLSRDEDNIDEIIEKDDLLKQYKDSFIKVDNEKINISSSQIRDKILKKEDVKALLPKVVYEYIEANSIYKSEQ